MAYTVLLVAAYISHSEGKLSTKHFLMDDLFESKHEEQFITFSLLSRPTNAQHTYINNIVYIVSTATCFDAPTSSSGFAKVTKSIKPAD